MEITIYIDGGSRGNPGPAAAGVVITHTQTDAPLHEGGYFLGRATNNVAEYTGLIRALQIAARYEPTLTKIYSDSQLMVRQITGEYRVKSPDLKPLFEDAQSQLLSFPHWQIHHVLRDKNKRADELVNMALDKKSDVVVIDIAEPGEHPDAPVIEQVKPEKKITNDAWTAQFCDLPGLECPAPASAGQVFKFGSTTPAGLCVHAAAIILEEGPLDWSPTETEGDTFCTRCKVRINLMRDEQ